MLTRASYFDERNATWPNVASRLTAVAAQLRTVSILMFDACLAPASPCLRFIYFLLWPLLTLLLFYSLVRSRDNWRDRRIIFAHLLSHHLGTVGRRSVMRCGNWRHIAWDLDRWASDPAALLRVDTMRN